MQIKSYFFYEIKNVIIMTTMAVKMCQIYILVLLHTLLCKTISFFIVYENRITKDSNNVNALSNFFYLKDWFGVFSYEVKCVYIWQLFVFLLFSHTQPEEEKWKRSCFFVGSLIEFCSNRFITIQAKMITHSSSN